MNQTTISCKIETSDPACPLGLEIWLDDLQIFNQEHVTETIEFCHDINDDAADHSLRFLLKNKPADYTQIDADGNIIKDARLKISDIEFDEIALNYMIAQQAIYTHSFNGAGAETQEKFYGEMGCNGVVSLKFSTPIYLWLLEHM
jgi:hypothetical protein